MNTYEIVAQNLWHAGQPLTKKEIAKIAEMIDNASADILVTVAPVPLKAYLLGYRVQELLKKAGSIDAMRSLLKQVKRPTVMDVWSKQQVVNAIASLIKVPKAKLADELSVQFLQDYMFSEITWRMDNMQNKIRTELLQAIMNHENPVSVARRLHRTFDTYDLDMRRVAITEITRARNDGALNDIQQTSPDGENALIYFMVAKDACPDCKRLYLNPDGSPRLFKVKDIRGKSNYGIPKKLWQPAMIIHPNCRCYPVKFDPVLMEWKKKWQAKYMGRNVTPPELSKAVKEDPVKDTKTVNGIKVAVEWPKHSIRTYDDSKHEVPMLCDYGRIGHTKTDQDGMAMDCYIGPNPDSKKCYQLTQLKKNGKFDEYKYMLGFDSKGEAKEMYQAHMPKWMYGGIEPMDWEDFEHEIVVNMDTEKTARPDKDNESEDSVQEGMTVGTDNGEMGKAFQEWEQSFIKAIGEQHRTHKYLRREGTPGKYRYIYLDEETNKEVAYVQPELQFDKPATTETKPEPAETKKPEPETKEPKHEQKQPKHETEPEKPSIPPFPKKMTPDVAKRVMYNRYGVDLRLPVATPPRTINAIANAVAQVNSVVDMKKMVKQHTLGILCSSGYRFTKTGEIIYGTYYSNVKTIEIKPSPNALAHEIGHYIDNVIDEKEKQTGLRAQRYSSNLGTRTKIGSLVDRIHKTTNLYQRIYDKYAANNPKRMEYLTKPQEVFARVFEQYVHSKLKGQGNVITKDSFVKHEYLTPEELEKIKPQMDAIFKDTAWGDMVKALLEINKALGEQRLKHKYIRREGPAGGPYKYIYADEHGKEYSGPPPAIDMDNIKIGELESIGNKLGKTPAMSASFNVQKNALWEGLKSKGYTVPQIQEMKIGDAKKILESKPEHKQLASTTKKAPEFGKKPGTYERDMFTGAETPYTGKKAKAEPQQPGLFESQARPKLDLLYERDFNEWFFEFEKKQVKERERFEKEKSKMQDWKEVGAKINDPDNLMMKNNEIKSSIEKVHEKLNTKDINKKMGLAITVQSLPSKKLGQNVSGVFDRNKVELTLISKSPHAYMHEYGHFIKLYIEKKRPRFDIKEEDDWDNIRNKIVKETKMTNRVNRETDKLSIPDSKKKELKEYFSSSDEVFARTFDQYVAFLADDQQDWESAQHTVGKAYNILTEKPQQFTHDEFKKIRPDFERYINKYLGRKLLKAIVEHIITVPEQQ